jgi:ferredoxin-NADP reductase/Na+-translocating ferredoxin:NAD+ oxidoreductase RnfD subunit
MKALDDFLNNITMYRLLLYYLIVLVIVASFFSLFGFLSFSFLPFVISVLFLLAVSLLVNDVFAKVFEAHTNVESVYISALILSLIISPANNLHDLIFLGWAAALTMASKYILAIGKKHIFNPVAIAIVLTAFVLGSSATWWVATLPMLPVVLVGGLLLVKKIQRSDLFFSFLASTVAVILTFAVFNGTNNFSIFRKIFVDSPIIFFASVMLTEPLTTPPTSRLRIWYGILVGVLFAPQLHVGSIYSTPELALIVGNVFSYIVSPKEKLMLKLKEVLPIGQNQYDYVFIPDKRFSFTPGQYMEWTLGHAHPDDRGNRRYFTLASSPTEQTVRLGIRFNTSPSSFKKTLFAMDTGSEIVAGQRSGDFVLPDDPKQKLVFIAGGIGITPYRSIITYLLDTKQSRDIVLIYSNKTAPEFCYRDVFDRAQKEIGMKTLYTLTDRQLVLPGWTGRVGRIDGNVIATEIPDYKERLFYVSGPSSLVDGFRQTLFGMGVHKNNIKTDFFPGFA